ncbi:MAG TPA: sugar ABC transporter permease [Candidatus Acetatifactor stercoripullorum]|uniref:Sugar ABC transporter permease n=1 Tax=Candidatus Acetatifactor stercoripullorum TaxID=2838414 RepID=A0A9D1R647_9FIRM|nr:sugar ABC transporter permease [Candidatus Acetatifactor stercoripullorum]HIW82416.1 sugar ABC transporter permease [Candidatus Acetatifactor stercoripullorum]
MKSRKQKYLGYLYIAPWLIGFFVLTLYPFVVSLLYSFTDYDMFQMDFVGLKNYMEIFTTDNTAMDSLGRTLLYTVVSVPLKLAMALTVALMLNKIRKGRGVFYTVFYLPSILGSSVALAILWKYVFKKDGLVNLLLGVIGIEGPNWLGNPDLALPVMMLLPLWQMGAPMVIFLAALKNVPTDLTEAARIDGAGPFRIFWKITLPMISPIIFFNAIMQTIEIIQIFTPAYLVTKGGPVKSTYLYSLYLYDTAFRDMKVGYASALSWILFSIIITFTLVFFSLSGKWVYYSDER